MLDAILDAFARTAAAGAVLERVPRQGVALRYCDAFGNVTDDANPNGSQDGIAGIANARGTIFGLMPHPERADDPLLGSCDGRFVFASLAAAIREPTFA